ARSATGTAAMIDDAPPRRVQSNDGGAREALRARDGSRARHRAARDGPGQRQHRRPPAGAAAAGGDPRPAPVLRDSGAGEHLLLRTPVLALPRRLLARGARVERTVGGRPARLRPGADPQGAGALLSRSTRALEGLAARGGAALGGALRPRVARGR